MPREIGGVTFPEQQGDQEFASQWQPQVIVRALAKNVLCAAKTRIEGSWSAYCDAVPGQRHEDEYQDVLKYGEKMPFAVAAPLFPEFAEIPYAR